MTTLLTNHPITHNIWDALQLLQALEYVVRYLRRIAGAINTTITAFTQSLIAPILSLTKIVEATVRVVAWLEQWVCL